jgi:Protein of unknown function (DUF4242)
MPRYLIERARLTGLSSEEARARARQSIEVADSMPGVVWIRSYISESEGKTYCEYEAPNPEAILEHARRAGLSVLKITPISMEIDPSMFR